jgi:hypothetical protein
MEQLTELLLGSATGKADDDNNTFNVFGLEAVLSALLTLPKLTVLDMQIPYAKEL